MERAKVPNVKACPLIKRQFPYLKTRVCKRWDNIYPKCLVWGLIRQQVRSVSAAFIAIVNVPEADVGL